MITEATHSRRCECERCLAAAADASLVEATTVYVVDGGVALLRHRASICTSAEGRRELLWAAEAFERGEWRRY